jgi:hypothetical protein
VTAVWALALAVTPSWKLALAVTPSRNLHNGREPRNQTEGGRAMIGHGHCPNYLRADTMPFGQKKEPAKKAGVMRFFSLDLHQVSTSVQTVTQSLSSAGPSCQCIWLRLITETDKR